LPPNKIDTGWPHLNPGQAAKIAKDAKVSKLALVHFDAAVYLKNKDRVLAQSTARKIFKNTLAAYDDLVEIILK